MAFTALFDANVLYPAPLRDLLLQLAMTKLFRARWTNTIHEEWIRIAKKVRPDIPSAKLDNLRKLMDAHAEDCLVTDFEPLIENLALPDPDDRHVLAAAIKGRADVIVTSNLKHFPEDELNTYDLNAQHTDVFIRHLIDLEPDAVADSARIVRARLKNPPVSVDRYLETLLQQGWSKPYRSCVRFMRFSNAAFRCPAVLFRRTQAHWPSVKPFHSSVAVQSSFRRMPVATDRLTRTDELGK